MFPFKEDLNKFKFNLDKQLSLVASSFFLYNKGRIM